MKYKCSIAFFFIISALFSQQKVLQYTVASGLPHDITYGLYQDSNGYIWIGTDDGLAKYDGKDFEIFTTNNGLSSNYVIDIKELSNHNLAIATWRGGLNILNTLNSEIATYQSRPKKLSNLEVYKDTIFNYHDYVNNIFWISNDSMISHKTVVYKQDDDFNLSEKKILSKPFSSLQRLLIDDTLYKFSTPELKEPIKGIYAQVIDKTNLVFPFLKQKVITSFNKISPTTYVAGCENRLFIFDKEAIIDNINLSIVNSRVIKILHTNDELIILTVDATGFKYAYSYNLKNKKLIDLRKELHINSTISDVLIDNESNLWISTFGDGLYFKLFNNENINTIPLDKNIIDIEFLKNEVVLLSNKSVSILEGFNLKNEIQLNGFGKHIKNMNDTLIVSSIDNSKKQHLDTNIIEQFGYRYFNLENYGSIIISNQIEFLTSKKTCAYNKLDYNIFDAFEFNDKLHFATNMGLFIYNEGLNKIEKDLILNSKLGKNSINAIITKGDTLFLGTDNGLWKLYNKSVKKINKENDLISKQINCMLLDHNQNIWIGTQKGLTIFDGNHFTNLNIESGLSSSFVSALKEDRNDNVWVAGNNGISIINNRKKLIAVPPPLLDIIESKFALEYNAISYNRTNLIAQYKINKNTWKNLNTSKGVLDFNNYKNGTYSMQIRAKKIDSDWVYSKPYNFKITAPWYKQWWFVLITSLSISLLFIMLILNRLKKSRLKNKTLQLAIQKRDQLESELISVRHHIAQDFHDDLGNKLARISIFSNLLKEENSSLKETDKEFVQQIATDANYLFKGTKDFIFSLQKESDYLEEVVTYLSDFGEDYLKQFNIVFEVEKNIQENIKLPYYWSKQIIFIFKEVITNLVKHANASKVILTFFYNSNSLVIICKDDGIGFDVTKLKHQNGINNIKTRAKKIDCELTISSSKNQGTTISFNGKTTQNV